ncbi:MAG: 6-phosphofructokinase [Actinomycetia bacterium]|nr:6-phosphofructokinase [Actinomycetes bacterium]MCP5032181.1 6-phosphofructokinase [Actinomycetes bacterium]
MRIGILTSGGDCPGLNAVIRAIVRKGERHYDDDLFGFLDGYRGLIENDWVSLDVESLRGILPRGGTVLGTSRINPYRSEDGVDRVLQTAKVNRLDAVIAIGGEGSLSCGLALHRDGVPIIGVPKTIDNDIGVTEYTFGFDTAVTIATEAIDRLHTTAESHNRVMVVEVMGRHVGHIATWAGIAGGATMTLIPEEPFEIDDVCRSLRRRHERGRFASIVVVAEGAKPAPGTIEIGPDEYDQYGHIRLGGIANLVAVEIESRTGFETRVTILGHVQRGGSPTAHDRVLSTRFGVAAIDAAHDEAWGSMVALAADEIIRVPLEDAVSELKTVSPELRAVARNFFA